jgi:hypothetical protein
MNTLDNWIKELEDKHNLLKHQLKICKLRSKLFLIGIYYDFKVSHILDKQIENLNIMIKLRDISIEHHQELVDVRSEFISKLEGIIENV